LRINPKDPLAPYSFLHNSSLAEFMARYPGEIDENYICYNIG